MKEDTFECSDTVDLCVRTLKLKFTSLLFDTPGTTLKFAPLNNDPEREADFD